MFKFARNRGGGGGRGMQLAPFAHQTGAPRAPWRKVWANDSACTRSNKDTIIVQILRSDAVTLRRVTLRRLPPQLSAPSAASSNHVT